MRAFISAIPTEHILYTHLTQRLEAIDGVTDDQKTDLMNRAAAAIEETVFSSYRKLIDHYAALEATASADAGVWKFPDGDRFYALVLRQYTTTDMPNFRRVSSFPAYGEGWALYAELVAAENGFQADPFDRLGVRYRPALSCLSVGSRHRNSP